MGELTSRGAKERQYVAVVPRPKELNKAIQNYPLLTIEEVATRLYGAKRFDVRHRFWHI